MKILKDEATGEELKNHLADLVEKHFPKGECQERGQAMVLVAKALVLFQSELAKAKSEVVEAAKACVPEAKKHTAQDSSQMAHEEYKHYLGIEIGWNECRTAMLDALNKLGGA